MVADTSQLNAEQGLNPNSWEFPLYKSAAFFCPVNKYILAKEGHAGSGEGVGLRAHP